MERIYGIREGSAGNSHTNNFNGNVPKTEKDLAVKMGVTQQTLQNYKQLAEMIPELEELVDTGIVTKTTALSMKDYCPINDKESVRAGTGRIMELRKNQLIGGHPTFKCVLWKKITLNDE